jgi:sec-independent protein translocase protein TatA
MPSIGPLELVILLVIVLLIFGPKRLPGLGRQLGSGMREFKDSITGKDKDDEDDESPRAIESSQATAVAEPPAERAQTGNEHAQAAFGADAPASSDATHGEGR